MDPADRLRADLAARDREVNKLRETLRIARLAAAEAEGELAQARAVLERLGRGPKGSNRAPTRRARTTGRRPRRLPDLPDGVFDQTPEAHRHVLRSSANLVLVDGYNVARSAWAGLAPEVERTRIIALLEELGARSRGRIIVVFDGASHEASPAASRRVTVRYSATGQTADDLLVDLLAGEPPAQPAVVVSSDRTVAADTRRHGALTLSSEEFLVALGR